MEALIHFISITGIIFCIWFAGFVKAYIFGSIIKKIYPQFANEIEPIELMAMLWPIFLPVFLIWFILMKPTIKLLDKICRTIDKYMGV